MEEDLKIKADLVIPGSELWFTASRSGGPGGQHVNKSSTRVTLHWDPSGSRVLNERQRERILRRLSPRVNSQGIVQVSVETTRSQLRNREMARKRLAGLIIRILKNIDDLDVRSQVTEEVADMCRRFPIPGID